MSELTHLDESGAAQMVDVGAKSATRREAVASCLISMRAETLSQLQSGTTPKGDIYQVARLAGMMAAKQTGHLIPLCHPLRLDRVEVHFQAIPPGQIKIESRVAATERTGVEMEALTAAAVAALTVYDMCKAIDREMVIGSLQLESKLGGKHGDYQRKGAAQ